MIYETPKLSTKRLILKRGTLEDYQNVYEYDFTKLRHVANEFKFEKYDPEMVKGMEEPFDNSYDWIMYLKDTLIPVGNVVADRELKEINSIELAFNTHPNYWKKGYTFEAINEILKFLFNKGYDNVICGYEEGNIGSKLLSKKLGFVPYNKIENFFIRNNITVNVYNTVLSK